MSFSDDPFEGLDEFFTDDDLSLTSLLGAFPSKTGPSTSSEKSVFLQRFSTEAPDETARMGKPNIQDPPGTFSVAAKVNRLSAQFSCNVFPNTYADYTRSNRTTMVNDARVFRSTETASQYHLRTMTPQRHHALANSLARHICQMRSQNSEQRKSTEIVSSSQSEDSDELSVSEVPKNPIESLTLSPKTIDNQLIEESKMDTDDHVAEFDVAEFDALNFSEMEQKRLHSESRQGCVMEHLPSLSLEDNDHGSTVSSMTDTKFTDASTLSSLEEGSEGSSENSPPRASFYARTTTAMAQKANTTGNNAAAVSKAYRRLGKEFRSHLQGLAPTTSTATGKQSIAVHELQARYVDLEKRKLQLEQETKRLQSQVGRMKQLVASVKCTSEEEEEEEDEEEDVGSHAPTKQPLAVDTFDTHTTKSSSCSSSASDSVPNYPPLFHKNNKNVPEITNVDNQRLHEPSATTTTTTITTITIGSMNIHNKVAVPVELLSPMGHTALGGLAQVVVQSGSGAVDATPNLKIRRERVRQQHFSSRFSKA